MAAGTPPAAPTPSSIISGYRLLMRRELAWCIAAQRVWVPPAHQVQEQVRHPGLLHDSIQALLRTRHRSSGIGVGI